LTVWGEVEPQNVGHHVDPEKALPYLTARVMSYFAPKSMHGLLQKASPGKKIKIKKRGLIFHVFARRSSGTTFGLRVRLVNRLRGLDSVSCRSLTIPIGLRCRR